MKEIREEILGKVYNHKGTLVKVDKLDKNEKMVFVTYDNWGYFLVYVSDLKVLDESDKIRLDKHPILSAE